MRANAGRLNKFLLLPLLAALSLFFLNPQPALAMHLAEGILPANWAALWYVIAAVFMFFAFRIIKKKTSADDHIRCFYSFGADCFASRITRRFGILSFIVERVGGTGGEWNRGHPK